MCHYTQLYVGVSTVNSALPEAKFQAAQVYLKIDLVECSHGLRHTNKYREEIEDRHAKRIKIHRWKKD